MEGIIIAIIGAAGAVISAIITVSKKHNRAIHELRSENRTDHGFVSSTLNRIEHKIDNHIDSHAKGMF